jgi:hypothetical protein
MDVANISLSVGILLCMTIATYDMNQTNGTKNEWKWRKHTGEMLAPAANRSARPWFGLTGPETSNNEIDIFNN